MAELLSIGQVGDEAGLPTSTLRYYDEIGLVEPATRIAGRRHYEPATLRRLRIVRLCQRAGFTLRETGQLLDGDWRLLAERKREELDRRIRELRDAKRLVQAALDCDCDDLQGCRRTGHVAPLQLCDAPLATKQETP